MNLLIVDDEMFAIQGILDGVKWETLGFDSVLTANSFQQAVEIFGRQKIEIMLCDIEMPNGNGIELAEWVKTHYPETECIFLTCHDDFNFAQRAIQLKCADYLLKPAPPEILAKVLAKVAAAVKTENRSATYQQFGQLFVDNLGANSEKPSTDSLIKRAETYIRSHIAEPLTVESLAASVFLSPDYLTRLFKKKYNQTVINYITEQRMFLARELIEKNELSVSEISDRVGYGNYSYFIRVFKRHFGLSPKEYQLDYLKKLAGYN